MIHLRLQENISVQIIKAALTKKENCLNYQFSIKFTYDNFNIEKFHSKRHSEDSHIVKYLILI